MPAAAVIPAPGTYTKFVVVKKLVVEGVWGARGGGGRRQASGHPRPLASGPSRTAASAARRVGPITVNKSTRSWQAVSALNDPAWNNGRGLVPTLRWLHVAPK